MKKKIFLCCLIVASLFLGWSSFARAADTISPAAIADLAVSKVMGYTVTLNWTATGNDGTIGTAAGYDIRFSTLPLTEANWASANQVTCEITPSIAGTAQSMVIAHINLNSGTTYYFAIKAYDSAWPKNYSPLSNVVSATTESTLPLVRPASYKPKLLWTAQRQAVWEQMKADYEKNSASPVNEGAKWYKYIKDGVEKECRYGDPGQSAMLMYQFTGNTNYAQIAWSKLNTPSFLQHPSPAGNHIREYFAEAVMMYEWLYPGLTEEQRTIFIDKLNSWADIATGKKYGQITGDSDQTTGEYFGLAFLDLIGKELNPRAGEFLNKNMSSGSAYGPRIINVGGWMLQASTAIHCAIQLLIMCV